MNEIHDVHRDIHHHVLCSTLPHRAINHAFGKNRYAGWDVGGLAVLAHLYYCMILRMGFIMEMTGLDKEEMEGI